MGTGLTIDTWTLDEPPDVVADLASLLSEDERRRAATFTRDEPRRRFTVARARLRERLGESLGAPPSTLEFRYGPAGKPELAGYPTTHFNLAHSADLAVAVLSDSAVGVDLERRRPMKNATGLAERWFHPAEVARIADAADPLAEFFRTWTLKEAALKLVGVGVGEALPRVLTPDAPEGGVATGLPANGLGLTACRVQTLTLAPGFAAAVATPG